MSKDGVTIGLNFSLLCNDYFLEVLFLVLLNMDINLGEWYFNAIKLRIIFSFFIFHFSIELCGQYGFRS